MIDRYELLIVMLVALMFQYNLARRVALNFITIPLIAADAGLGLYLFGQSM